MNSPSLIENTECTPSGFPRSEFEIDEIEFREFIESRPVNKVGRYFENLIHYYLGRIAGVAIIAHGVQVRQHGRTLGELDFVFRNRDGKLHHWEIAVKFYLYQAKSTDQRSRYIGPNPADCFESKLDRLLNRQLPLSSHLFPDIAHRTPFLKGRIFYPLENDDSVFPPSSVNGVLLTAEHLRGTWIYCRQAASFFQRDENDELTYRILRKPCWLTSFSSCSSERLSANQLTIQILEHFRTSRHALMLAQLRREGDAWTESNRIFVVSDRWPDDSLKK